MSESWICFAKRTPIGKFQGALANVDAPHLTATLIKDFLTSTSLPPDKVDEIIIGQVLTAGVGQAPARQAAIYGGMGHSVCATTVGRVCGSGLKSVMLADQAIRLGDQQCILAGGQESMSLAPHILPKSRQGYRFGKFEVLDSMQHDGLWDPYGQLAMGACGEVCAKEYNFSRESQDNYAVTSYQRARSAIEHGRFAQELVPVEVTNGKQVDLLSIDEEPFAVNLEKLPKLRPAFDPQGTITAGNASSINDGAALVLVCSPEFAKQHQLTPLARIVAQSSHAQDPMWFTTAPVACVQKLLKKAKKTVNNIDLFEINEAFSLVPMAAMRDLKIDHEKVNVFGGAVSMGHPIGCSGTRILVTLIHALKTLDKTFGIATLCIGGGEASALLVERM